MLFRQPGRFPGQVDHDRGIIGWSFFIKIFRVGKKFFKLVRDHHQVGCLRFLYSFRDSSGTANAVRIHLYKNQNWYEVDQ